jgi:actin-related protein 3
LDLYIAVQAVLALATSWTSNRTTDRTLTGTIIDLGDSVTHVIPYAEGYVIDYSYVCQDIIKEFWKYDAEPYKYLKR